MNKKAFCGLIFLCFCVFQMEAQDIKDANYKKYKSPYNYTTAYRAVLKYYPTALLNPASPTFQVGIQRRFSAEFQVEVSAGYATTFGGRWAKPVPLSGVLLRLETMYIMYESFQNKHLIGFQGIYKNIDEHPTEEFSRFNDAYRQLIAYDLKREQFAGHILYLFQRKIGERWLIELGSGIGIRSNDRVDTGIPEDAVSVEEQPFFDFDEPGRFTYPSMHLRLGVGFRIFRKNN